MEGGALREQNNAEESGVKFLYAQCISTFSNRIEVEMWVEVSAKGIEKSSIQLHEVAVMLFSCAFDASWKMFSCSQL